MLARATCALAEPAAPSAEAVFLSELIEHPATRALVLSKLDPLPPECTGLPQRTGMRVRPDTRLSDDANAQQFVLGIRSRIEAVARMTKLVTDPALHPEAEKHLAITQGLIPNPPISSAHALYDLVGFHQRKLSFELLSSQLSWHENGVWVPMPDGRTVERHVIDQLTLIDLPAIADIICDRLNAFDYDKEFGPLTKAQRAMNEPFVRYLCAALDIKYSVPFGGWTPGNLKSYAIKQLRHAAKRPNLAPADAEAIATALHQLETFQPDPMNAIRL